MTQDTFLFTSESVNEGHPDKLCDQVRAEGRSMGARWCSTICLSSSEASQNAVQVSDAVLDACLAQDPDSKVSWHRSACGLILGISTFVCSLLNVVVWYACHC